MTDTDSKLIDDMIDLIEQGCGQQAIRGLCAQAGMPLIAILSASAEELRIFLRGVVAA